MSRCAPASVPSCVVSRPSTSLISRPTSSKRSIDAPTVGMASVTKAIRSAPFAANAVRTETGSTWMPSTISPAVSPGSDNAVPTMPGARALKGGIALNKCVTPVAPSATACTTTAADASLCPIEIRTPAEANVMTKPAGTHSGASVTTERPAPASSDNCSRSPAPGCTIRSRRCTPGRCGLMNGPSRCTPRTPLRPAAERAAAITLRICSRVSVIQVGRHAVVP